MRKDYNIHTEWADAERERRRKSMQANEERRGIGCTAGWWYCRKCKGRFHGPEFLYCPCVFDCKQHDEDHKLREVTEQELIDLESELSEEDITTANKVIDHLTKSDKLNDEEWLLFQYAYEFIENDLYGNLDATIQERYNSDKYSTDENIKWINNAMDRCVDITTRIMPYIIHNVKQSPWYLKTVW